MKSKFCLFLFLSFSCSSLLFARGFMDESEIETEAQKNEWILCIADFDTGSLSGNKKNASELIMRKLVESLNSVNYRTRVSPEYAYYEEVAWSRARLSTARALAAKQNERASLLYRGDPEWRYRRNLERIENEINELWAVHELTEGKRPLIDREPVFGLSENNLEFKFPKAPQAGNEYRFCTSQKSDALLTGSIIDFHDRFIVSWKLYTIFTQSFVWEDSIIFSPDDLDAAMDEITHRLLAEVSGNEPSVLTVRAVPEDTLVLINRAFAGRGEISSSVLPPGSITVTASAPAHEDLTFTAEILPGEHTVIEINLLPVEYADVDIAGTISGRVYHGALYIGEAPLTLRLPLRQMEYIELGTPDTELSAVVFQTPDNADVNKSLFLKTSVPPPKGSVDRARRNFYWAWGASWITGVAAWLTYQSYTSSNLAISHHYNQTGTYDQSFYDDNMRFYRISMGTVIAFGAAVAFDLLFIGRYISSANKGAASIIRTGGI